MRLLRKPTCELTNLVPFPDCVVVMVLAEAEYAGFQMLLERGFGGMQEDNLNLWRNLEQRREEDM